MPSKLLIAAAHSAPAVRQAPLFGMKAAEPEIDGPAVMRRLRKERQASPVRHAMFEMVMARVCAIACGHEDAIDLDRLQHDPLMKVAVGRCPQSGAPLASQSTISRLENAPRKTEAVHATSDLWRFAGNDRSVERQSKP
jgi:hypothetical protein